MFFIQTLNNAHCKEIIDLVISIQQEELHLPVTLEGQPDLFDIETCYIQTGGNFWGAFINGQLIGTIGLLQASEQTGVIRKMFVRKAFRGSGYGIAQALLNTLISYCRAKGLQTLYLGTIDVLKAAHRFYEKSGFTRVDVTELPSCFPRMMADNTFYYLALKTDQA
ncbi:GNAT family acetyltransferase [Niabella ginsenosidivorans]|uniref:GNAT family acetyltransferase n=1 Tax=Niabella ginsenosidivorans TaxID=1176587 RepID=A0A1A9I8C8_9BACT|nr:GNAT family N-acetyltransferase [Niabella ginsenosidivorans]ANH83927.1 GNAT family acetyltransferase [Niabella ginsenosidivorans]